MNRKLLTDKQTKLMWSIRSLIKSAVGRPVTITDVLTSVLNKDLLNSVTKKIIILHERRYNSDKPVRKEYNVYIGEVLSNGLVCRAIVAARSKKHLHSILGIDWRQAVKWKKSNSSIHEKIAIASPCTFFGIMPSGPGRPVIDKFYKLTNVKRLP